MIDKNFWKNKRVLITGHTGFKGSWLSLWLVNLGAKVAGYALSPHTQPNLFETFNLKNQLEHNVGDIADYENLQKIIKNFQPEIIFHLASRSIVKYSYQNPVETYRTNVMGAVNLLEIVRKSPNILATIMITSDKCYENINQKYLYQENDKLSGNDPYSSSKACVELVTLAYTKSYFLNSTTLSKVASARCGNVIGGGDWSIDRLLPDLVSKFLANETAIIRKPQAIRPWLFVLDSLCGYLLLAQYLANLPSQNQVMAYNFAPDQSQQISVLELVNKIMKIWGTPSKMQILEETNNFHEENYLLLDSSKARRELGWLPKFNIDIALDKTIKWYQNFQQNNGDILDFSLKQITNFDK
ncbi:MAG: CDP-glucose 4,6-dehydratase [Alphaproteobacteria bacterium]